MNLAEKARIAREEAEKEQEQEKRNALELKKKQELAEQEAKERAKKEKQDELDLQVVRNELEKIANKKVGKVVTFGKYMQNKKDDPIEWIVIKNVAGEMTLLSKCVLDCMSWTTLEKFDKNFDYKNSTVREFLNNEFYNTAFSSPEKKAIKLTSIDSCRSDSREVITWTIDTETNQTTTTTDDYVYLLSKLEAEQIKTKFLEAKPTKYAVSKYFNHKFWLRDSYTSKYTVNYKSANQREVTSLGGLFYGLKKAPKSERGFSDYCLYVYDEYKQPSLQPQDVQECKKFGIRPVITIKTDI